MFFIWQLWDFSGPSEDFLNQKFVGSCSSEVHHVQRVCCVSLKTSLDGAVLHMLPFLLPWDGLWASLLVQLKNNSTDTLSFFLRYLFLKMSRDLAIASHVSVLTWASFAASHVSCREFMQLCIMPSTLYGDPTSLKLCHREIKSCNDFQYIDMDNNCIG